MITLKINPIETDIKIKIAEIVTEGGGGGTLPYYKGSYSVTPDFEKQILETKNKSMSKNVEIKEIPITEVSNTYGTTFILGGKE